MSHIPPIRFTLVAGEEPIPFTIQGKENEITITLPTSYDVQTSMSEGGGRAATAPAPAKIARIELVGVQQVSNLLVFSPATDGRSEIKISFDHSHKS